MKTLLGTKIGMTQIIGEDGVVTPITLVQAGPVTVTQVKTVETDGYNAVQVAFGEGKNLSKAVAGHTKPAKVKVLLEQLSDITLTQARAHTVETETYVVLVQSDRCIHKKSSKVKECLDEWDTIKLLLKI